MLLIQSDRRQQDSDGPISTGTTFECILRTYVDAKDCVEHEPNDDDRCKEATELGDTKWLEEEEDDENTAGRANDGSTSDIWYNDLKTCCAVSAPRSFLGAHASADLE